MRVSVTILQSFRSYVGDHHICLVNVRRQMLSSVLAILCTLSGCCKPFDSHTKQENEAARDWVTASWTGQYDWVGIAEWKIVRESNVQRANALLHSLPVIEIKESEANELIGEPDSSTGSGTPYLLRGVGDAPGTFPLELAVRPDGTVWVGGGANSKCRVAMRRRPSVAWLSKMPRKVYVTFYVNRD